MFDLPIDVAPGSTIIQGIQNHLEFFEKSHTIIGIEDCVVNSFNFGVWKNSIWLIFKQ